MSKKIMRIRAKAVIVKLREMFGEGIEFACVDCYKANEALTGITMKLPGCSKVAVFYLEDSVCGRDCQHRRRCFSGGDALHRGRTSSITPHFEPGVYPG